MQLLNGASRGGSVFLEVILSLALIIGVSVGMYEIQHPHETAAQRTAAAMQQ